jgi:hypothetical protein
MPRKSEFKCSNHQDYDGSTPATRRCMGCLETRIRFLEASMCKCGKDCKCNIEDRMPTGSVWDLTG